LSNTHETEFVGNLLTKKKVEFLIKKFKSNLSQLIIKKYIGRTIEIQFYN